jgi:hypothetical protein
MPESADLLKQSEKKSRVIVLASGIVLEVLALAKWDWQPWSGICAGVGGSVLATVLVGIMGSEGDKLYQTFLRLGVTDFHGNRNKVADDYWVAWLRLARRHWVQLGQANGNWFKDPHFRPALLERVNAGVQVEIFFLNPHSNAAESRAGEDLQNITPLLTRIKASIRVAWAIRQELDYAARERLKLYVYNATPSLGLTWIDDKMIVTLFTSKHKPDIPGFRDCTHTSI